MGLILNRIKKFTKGYPTTMNNHYVQGGILEGNPATNGAFLVFGTTDGFYSVPEDASASVKNIAGVLLATNVKTVLSYGDNPVVTTEAGESFNLLVEGFVALPVATDGNAVKEGDAVYVTADGEVANAATVYNFNEVNVAKKSDLTSYYELKADGSFAVTTDTEVDTGKVYFTKGASKTAVAVANARFSKGIDTDEDGVLLANVHVDFRNAKAE